MTMMIAGDQIEVDEPVKVVDRKAYPTTSVVRCRPPVGVCRCGYYCSRLSSGAYFCTHCGHTFGRLAAALVTHQKTE